MKLPFFILIFFISFLSFSQTNHIVKTEDGRRVLLKADYTWEYIDKGDLTVDASIKEAIKTIEENTCNIEEGFVEPKLDSKIQAKLKRGRSTISHVKKKVAKDSDCNVSDVLLIDFTEQKEKAVYHFCVRGKKVTYKRIGNSIIKAPKFF